MSHGRLEHRYECWGLGIHSEIRCPELMEGNGEREVVVRFGKVPDHLADVKISGVFFEMSEDEFLLKVDDVAKYWVRRGNEITIEPFESTEEKAIRLFLLGSAFGALLHQRGLVPFHGSAVEIGGKAVMFVGPSAVGKSTLAASLCQEGCRLLADDVCVIREDPSGRPFVLPGYPQAKLWADALKALGKESHDLSRVRSNMEKYGLPLRSSFCDRPLPLGAVYILSITNGGGIEVEQVSGKDKFVALNANTYRLFFLEGLNDKSSHYRTCMAASLHARLISVRRPQEPFMLHELSELIVKECSW